MTEITESTSKSARVAKDQGFLTAQFLIPTGISILALTLAGFQFYENYRLNVIQETPNVDFESSSDTDDSTVGIQLINNGPAVAQVRKITYYIDKKRVGSVNDLVDFADLQNAIPLEMDKDDTMHVGEADWLLSQSTKIKNKDDKDELDKFVDVLDHRLGVEAEICSIFTGKCEKRCSRDGWCD
jgi:hypothetical protein